MAVQEQTPLQEYTANGIAKQFDLEFDCESADHLIVSIDDLEVLHTDWYLSGNAVAFYTAPANGKQIKIQRNTPFNRLSDYQTYNNSFRPPVINKEFDRIWWKLQELGVADWILSNRISALKAYVDDRDDELRAYLLEEIRKQGVALDQLDEYYNYLMQRLAKIAVDKGWDASFVVDASGKTQQEINDNQAVLNTGLESIADMLAIPNPKNGSRVYVKSYHTGLGVGGKFFVYSASKSTVNDGGRCINGWIAQKEALDIHDFGTTKYTGTDWTGGDYNLSAGAYYVPSSVYNNYKNYCDSVKQKGYFPNGDYVIQDGSYKLPKCGLRGDDKESTRIFTALTQAGKIFEYNTLGVYSTGFANFIEDLTIYTHRKNKACFVLTVNTPTRGAKGANANFYSSGEILNYYDVWYLKWGNCGFYGYYRGTTISNSDPLSAIAFVNKNNGETNNTYYDKCSVLDVKHVFMGRKAGFMSSGVGLLFANCSFERIGECAFDLMYTNTTFLTCHFEQLGLHNGFKTPAIDFDRTILIYAGENTVNLVGNGNIWLGGSTPNNASYSIFNAEGRALIDLGSYKVTKNNRPLISTVGTYATGRYCSLRGGVVVNSEYSNTNPIDIHFSNIGQLYRQKSNQSQHLISGVEKASTTYQSVAHHPLITGSTPSRSVCVVSARVYETPVLVRISGRVIRVGNTNKKCAQYLDIDASFLIEPLTPTNPQVINFNVVQKGVDNTGLPIAAGKSLFGVVDETALKALFTFKRLTAENTDSVSPFDVTYALVMSTAWTQIVADVGGVWQVNDVKTEVTFAQEASKDLPHLSYIHNHNNVYV